MRSKRREFSPIPRSIAHAMRLEGWARSELRKSAFPDLAIAKGRQIAPPPLPQSPKKKAYFRLVTAVRSKDSLAMPAAPHQLEPAPPGLIGVMLVVPVALNALVKALQLPLLRSVSE